MQLHGVSSMQRVSCIRMSHGSKTNVRCKRDGELCRPPHASTRALRWAPKTVCDYLQVEGSPHRWERHIPSGELSGPRRKSREQCF